MKVRAVVGRGGLGRAGQMASSDFSHRVDLAARWIRLMLLEIYSEAATSPLSAAQIQALLDEVDLLLAGAEANGPGPDAL